jgi:histidine ammonia-lyase
MAGNVVKLGTGGLGLGELVDIARKGVGVALDAAARTRIERAFEVVCRLQREGAAVYGVTTGLGAAVDISTADQDPTVLQTRLPQARGVGVGRTARRDEVRAIMAARAATLAQGGSGISPATLDALIAMLNAGVHPSTPLTGSLGEADLAPLAHIALPLVGAGEAEFGGEVLAGGEALKRAKIVVPRLGPKDGLALVNSNAATIGLAALAAVDARQSLDALAIAAAMSMEAQRASLTPLDRRAQAARPAPGQDAVAARLAALLAGSALWRPGAARNLQDPLSFRIVSQVHGAARAACDAAVAAVELELASRADSPLVLADDGAAISTGNFDVTHVALALEALGQALTRTAALAVERCAKLMSPRFSDLPRFLSPIQQGRTGFATVQKTLAALVAEMQHLANPAPIFVMPVADRVEDYATMAPMIADKTAAIALRLRLIAAIELMIAAQAYDLRGIAEPGAGVAAAHRAVRAAVPPLGEDRSTAADIAVLDNLIASDRLAAAVAAALAVG